MNFTMNFTLQLTKVDRDSTHREWNLLLPFIMHLDHATHLSQTLIGAQSHEAKPKQTKERVAREKPKVVNMKQPKNVERLDKEETSAQVLQYVLNTVYEHTQSTQAPIPYYELIMNPNDYMSTVDNAFQIAFLARDGALAVKPDANGNIGVSVVSEAEKQATNRSHQGVMTIAVEDWMEMAKNFGDREPILKTDRDVFIRRVDTTCGSTSSSQKSE